ncbi:MAG: sigma-54-dependent Fis family transcriptional regulator [Candidatus Marinimicrobia bacterium]|nr:sigma-54-dependent Fis family transcriptional regulator [Candidatus Neomarinimicrobiota bacterium]
MGRTILIVDDEVRARSYLKEILEEEGYEVLTASGFGDTMEVISQSDINLILLDLHLPEAEDGLQLLKEIAKTRSNVPIIVMSKAGSIQKAMDVARLGVYDFLEKPFEGERWLLSIRNAIEKGSLEAQLDSLRNEIQEKYKMVGVSRAIQGVCGFIEKVAHTEANVLILGETGVGKDLAARAIHFRSPRAGKPFVKFNCANIPPELLESELFGYRKGAFTDAREDRRGWLEVANGGTLFLDEIGDMHPRVQAKLLDVLEHKEFVALGSRKVRKVNVRIVAATNRDLGREVQKGKFRRDLYSRLSVATLYIPPLRERKEDIGFIARYFLKMYCQQYGFPEKTFSPAVIRLLEQWDWRDGNVRALKNAIERIVIFTPPETTLLLPQDVLPYIRNPGMPAGSSSFQVRPLKEAVADYEKEYIFKILSLTNWNVLKAAELLKVNRTTLYRKLQGLTPHREI